MKNYIQYHNAAKQGVLKQRDDGLFYIFAKKSIQYLRQNRVWLISGHGKTSPKQYYLEYVFLVNDIFAGSPNVATGKTGNRFRQPILLNDQPWFKEFLASQQNFSLGVREIAREYVVELEQLIDRVPAAIK